jgi:hypothetical protein
MLYYTMLCYTIYYIMIQSILYYNILYYTRLYYTHALIQYLAHAGLSCNLLPQDTVATEPVLNDQDLYLMFDGFKEGNDHTLLSAFVNGDNKALERAKRPIRLLYDEESMTARLGLVRGFSTLNQLETVYIVTKAVLNLKAAKRLHYSGTNHGNCISPVVAPAWDQSTWRLSVKDKKHVLGTLGKVLAGGPNTYTAEEKELSKTRARAAGPEGVEPVFFHGGPVQLCEELHHSYKLRNIIDLTVGKGDWAMTAMSRRVPFVGVALSHKHRDELLKYLVASVMDAFQAEDHTLYQPSMVDAIATAKKAEKGEKASEKGAKGKGADAEGKAKPKTSKAAKVAKGSKAGSGEPTDKQKLLAKIKALHKQKGKKQEGEEDEGEGEDDEDEGEWEDD